MSPKSRQPKGGKGGKKKGRKGKKGQETSTTYEEVVIEENGLPFGIVVLIALAMALPSLMAFFDGTLEFRPTIVRVLAALLVSWLLCSLVYSVVRSFGGGVEETTRTETRETVDGYGYGDDPYGQDRQAS